ncbi:acyl carrier protein [Algicola sagamiensis]|uniref:acyl carrier protein n=1 Tax=Algicola sagamiensis TaxID=163869 RepID=UPI00037ED1AE|nr:acyl carrier protein [Algicola sagamiensis]
MNDKIKNEILQLFRSQINEPDFEITDEMILTDVVSSSLKMLKIIASIEKCYGVTISEEQIFELETFSDLFAYIASQYVEEESL